MWNNETYYAELVNQADGRSIVLDGDMLLIGRATNNSLAFSTDRSMSAYHAVILRAEGRYLIEDLGSTNGTFVNGQRITGRNVLSDGDSVQIGLKTLLFVTEKELKVSA
jgi:pSer/pThr/pTyr-binding forkhead associated (FHA) protein